MKYLSLFTGIGGFELGIQQAYEISNMGRITSSPDTENRRHLPLPDDSDGNGRRSDTDIPECIGFSEIDKYATQIYQKHFPNHKNYGDITKIIAEELPDFDCLVGGFPCQSFSIAGLRRGFLDTRGTLFFDIARILKAKRPTLLLLENVKGLLSHDEWKTFSTIVWTLDELGYDIQWQVLNSKNFGVPQNRERVFIVGHFRGEPRPEVFPFTENGGQADELPRHISNTLTARYEGAQAVGTYIGESKFDAQKIVRIPEATKKGYAEATVGQSINLAVPNSKTRRGRVSDIAQTLDTGMQQHTLTEDMKIRRLTPTECERLQGFPDGWTEGVSDTQRYKCLGNAVTVNVIEAVVHRLLDPNHTHRI